MSIYEKSMYIVMMLFAFVSNFSGFIRFRRPCGAFPRSFHSFGALGSEIEPLEGILKQTYQTNEKISVLTNHVLWNSFMHLRPSRSPPPTS